MNPYQINEDNLIVWTNKMKTIAHKGVVMYRPDGSKSRIPLFNMEPQPDGRVLQKQSNLGTMNEIIGRHIAKGFTLAPPSQEQVDAIRDAREKDPDVIRAEREAVEILAKEAEKTTVDRRKEDQLNAMMQKKKGKKK